MIKNLCKKNICLREITIQDTDNILKWRNTKDVRQNLFTRNNITKDDHLRWLENKVEKGHCIQFIIFKSDEKVDFGTVFIKNIDNSNKKGEFGIFIGENNYRGKGYGRIAAELILEYTFNHTPLNRVYLKVLEENVGAIKSYRNAGFVYEGTLRQSYKYDNNFYDVVVMSILKNSWMER
ncbi:MAG: UDP-4-amino-4,6-dideoxy-N-acetyl-beta-L-altrosamine N-acetyltransferase [Halanaerobiales bacterium]|nr:UDP-4-amino-4,6-dideoxy-N-acetyl-beta-L-altrosamine N-acetyltransferase [Halanaerobiales bacterium]